MLIFQINVLMKITNYSNTCDIQHIWDQRVASVAF